MIRPRIAHRVVVGLMAAGLPIQPCVATEAAGDGGRSARAAVPVPIADVELDQAGWLHGIALDARGAGVAGLRVVLSQQKTECAATLTSTEGHFLLGPLRGGCYELRAGEHVSMLRAWAAGTAPPAASRVMKLTLGPAVVRGQMPLEQFFCSDDVICVGMLAAMIGLPIALHNSRGGPRPASP